MHVKGDRSLQHLMLCVLALMSVSSIVVFSQSAPGFPAPKTLGNVNSYGRHIQRTMKLLATSTPQQRNTVRILFYGQSITEQNWWRIVADDLRRRFPHANLIIENRAIGGHSSQLLVKTAEADLYSFYPDLLIFQVYGSHVEYENIIRRVRERTTAEILMQNDHIVRDEDLTEETRPAKLQRSKETWSQWMNHVFLPKTARKYDAEFCDQRALWKQYLRDYNLPAKQLLSDNVHLNAHGEFLMAEFVKAWLRYDPKLAETTQKGSVKTYRVGRDVKWKGAKLSLDFEGNRVDVVLTNQNKSRNDGTEKSPAGILLDGKAPSQFSELYGFTRTSAYPDSIWPCLLRVSAEKPLLLEDWTLTITEISDDHKIIKFTLAGSHTGADGAGTSEQKFISPSGRIVIEPEDWNLEYCLRVFKKPIAAGFQIRWKVVPHFINELAFPEIGDPAIETSVTLAQGLSNSRHLLEIAGAAKGRIAAIRVYRPSHR